MTDPRYAARAAVIARARELGFHAVGVTDCAAPARHGAYLDWLEAGRHGEMAYMAAADHVAARGDLSKVAAGARSLVAVAMAYDHRDDHLDVAGASDELRGRIARYARGRDYHGLLKERLYQLADDLAACFDSPVAARPCVDSAPVLERELGERAGIGFVGKNTMLITPGLGSYTLLGELLTATDIAPTEPPTLEGRCGDCTACLDACPTGALPEAFVLDANRCISYLTIEHRGPIPVELRRPIADMVFGCDICQDVCPYNTAAPSRHEPAPALVARDLEHARPALATLATLGSNAWKRYSHNSAIRRAGRHGLARNVAVALGNSGHPAAIEGLSALLGSPDRTVVNHAAWGLREVLAAVGREPAPASTPIEVRAYTDDDHAAIAEAHDLARLIELDASGLLEAFLPLKATAAPEGLFDDRVLVATSGDRAVGFVATRPDDGAMEISWLYVHPRWHRRGIARALLVAAMDGERGAIDVVALAENAVALALYQSLGFVAREEIVGKLEGNERFPARGVRLRRDPLDS